MLAAAGGGTPGGSSGQVQYNAAGVFGGAAFSVVATSGDLLKLTAGASTDVPLKLVCHASQSGAVPVFQVETSGGTDVLSLIAGTTTETLLVLAVPSGAGGPSGVRIDVDGSSRWTFFSSGATSYAFNLARFGGSEGFTCSTGGIFTINTTLCMPQRTGDPSGVSNSAHIYVKDVAGTAEVFVRDEAGNVTQISPHAADGPADLYDEAPGVETVYRSVSESTGQVEWLNWSRLAQAVERLTGEKLRHVETVAEYDARRTP